ncbi:MAG: nucleotidyltransferase family protein [Micropepsaceae bacterium]
MSLSDSLIAHALADPVNGRVLDVLDRLAIPDAWLVSGCVFQAVWNGLTGRAPGYGINDYDVFYFDPDDSYEAEDAVIKRCAAALGDLTAEVQVRNQARVPLWYPQKFGRPYAPVANATEGLERFLAPCCAVGIRRKGGRVEIAAPFGLADVFAMVIRPNELTTGPQDQYESKAARWKSKWPEIRVLPWV